MKGIRILGILSRENPGTGTISVLGPWAAQLPAVGPPEDFVSLFCHSRGHSDLQRACSFSVPLPNEVGRETQQRKQQLGDTFNGTKSRWSVWAQALRLLEREGGA